MPSYRRVWKYCQYVLVHEGCLDDSQASYSGCASISPLNTNTSRVNGTVQSDSGTRLRRATRGHQDRVGAVAFSPDSKLITSASDKSGSGTRLRGSSRLCLKGHQGVILAGWQADRVGVVRHDRLWDGYSDRNGKGNSNSDER